MMHWRRGAVRVLLLALLASGPALAAEMPAPVPQPIDSVWPLCRGWKTLHEQWEWITPADLTAQRAREALDDMAPREGKFLDGGEALDILQMDAQILEGYRLLVLAKRDIGQQPEDSGDVKWHRRDVRNFCKWITTNTFPE